jgi:uncharacterized membrane protein
MPLALFASGAARVILGLLFVLFFPGYALTSALFPQKTQLSRIERLALSFGLSIAVVPLLGLMLNYTPWGIHLLPILISVLLFILVMSAIALERRSRLQPEQRFEINIGSNLASLSRYWISQKQIDKYITVVLVVAVIGALGTLGYVIATAGVGEKYSEFYILGANGKAEDYPKQLAVGQTGKVIVGVVNHEQESRVYRVKITIEGKKIDELGPINLNDADKWEQVVTFSADTPGPSQKVGFLLYQGENVEPSQSVHLWVDVK